jgi:hypothetical protein
MVASHKVRVLELELECVNTTKARSAELERSGRALATGRTFPTVCQRGFSLELFSTS